MRTPPRTLACILTVSALLGVAACGDDGSEDASHTTTSSSTTASTTSTTEPARLDGDLPPVDALDLEPLYGEQLAEIGVRITDRGGLIDRSGGYEQSSEGTHLAVYVEPIGDYTIPQYIEGIRSVAQVFSDVFDRWPGLESFDVCQEPVPTEEDGDEPLPLTQIDISRSQAAAIDWSAVTVVDLVEASLAEPPGLTLRVSSAIARDPAYEAIVELATA